MALCRKKGLNPSSTANPYRQVIPMKSHEDFIAEITLGNASQSEIKAFIRAQARRISQLEAKLEMIELKKKEKQLNRKRATLKRFIERNSLN